MPHRLLAVLIGGLLLLPAAASAAPADVRLRAEGVTQTLVPRTTLRTDNRVVNKDGVAGDDCTGTSAAGALEIATGGDWTGSFFGPGLGYSVSRILGESHPFPDPNFFELWINNRSSPVGICGVELQEGDDVLFIVARCEVGPPPDFACLNPPVLPLGLTVPSTVAPGAPFNARVVEFATDGTPSPVAGATVDGGDAPAVTGADGIAAVTLGAAGPRTLVASKTGRARSAAEAVCATSGADGLCGTAVPAAAVACETNGADGRCGTRDTTVPGARIDGIRDHQRFARGKGPRALRLHVASDASGLLTVKLRLTRNDRGRCTYFSGKFERFRRTRGCGAANGFWFAVGDREDTTYLLPGPLPRGHYVLDVNAIDKAYNRDDPRRRGGNRIVFDVG